MLYEIQAELIPGNNQLWSSIKDQSNNYVYIYNSISEAENMLNVIKNSFPEGTNFRILEKEN